MVFRWLFPTALIQDISKVFISEPCRSLTALLSSLSNPISPGSSSVLICSVIFVEKDQFSRRKIIELNIIGLNIYLVSSHVSEFRPCHLYLFTNTNHANISEILIALRVVRIAGQNVLYFLTQTLFRSDPVPLLQMRGVHAESLTHWSHLLNEFAHCGLLPLLKVGKAVGSTS